MTREADASEGTPDGGAAGGRPDGAGFLTTRWSVVLAAGTAPSPESRRALDVLAGGYWYPLYAYLRRRGCDDGEARDLTQGFFARLLERGDLARVDPGRGRFRAYLLAGVKNHLAGERERRRAEKRGGGVQPLRLGDADTRYTLEPVDEETPERIFERSWARTVLERAVERLRASYAGRGKGELFEHLGPHLAPGSDPPPYADLAPLTGLTEGALKVAVHRMRQRYGRCLREEIADTVSDPSEVEDEIRQLMQALGR